MNHSEKKSVLGFTLAELAMVLVIIGLLVGGVIAGQSIIKGAELNGTISEITKYATAVQQFRSVHNALPGDMSNASDYWGPTVSNGNGDRVITKPGSCTETYQVWQHLSYAGLVDGSYTVSNACGNIPGTNTPMARITKNTYTVHTEGASKSSDATFFDGYYDIILNFGGANASSFTLDPLLSPEEMWNIDAKADDAQPQSGALRAYKTLTACNSTTEYLLTSKEKACRGLFAVTPITPL